MLLDGSGEPRWISDPLGWRGDQTGAYEFYSAAFVRIAEVDPDSPGREVLAVAGGNVRCLSPAGELLAEAEAPVGFADLLVDEGTLYLGSTPNGDETIYRVDLDGDWPAAIRGLKRHGLAREIGDELETLRRRVLACEGESPAALGAPSRPGWVQLFGARPRQSACQRWRQDAEWFARAFPYPNLQPVAGMKVIEESPPLDSHGKPWNPRRWRTDTINGTMTVEEIVAAAELIEAERVPTVFLVGHSCMPFITLGTAGRMLDAAPNYLVGFLTAEDEQPDAIGPFFRDWFRPLGELCARKGSARVMTKNKNVWWMSVPAQPGTFEDLFGDERGRTLVAATEDSNSRTPEINLMARVGLRQAGLIDRFQVSTHGDLFSYCRFHQWEYPKHGHPFLRLLVAQTVLGGTDYRLGGWLTRRVGRGGEESGAETAGGSRAGELAFTRMGRESAEIFLHMRGKGLVFPPAPEQMAGLSPVGLAVHQAPEKWLRDGHNGHQPHRWRDDPELHDALIPHNGCLWGNTPTPAHAFQHVAFRKTRQFGYFVPPTPYGAVAIVPAEADLSAVAGVREWWHTDGIYLWREDGGPGAAGEKLTGQAAADFFRTSLEAAAASLPFRPLGDDVFFHSVRLPGGSEDTPTDASDARFPADLARASVAGPGAGPPAGRYRLYAVDPGWLDPQERRIRIRVQVPGKWRITDVLTGEDVPVTDNEAALAVPAGSLRILEAGRAE